MQCNLYREVFILKSVVRNKGPDKIVQPLTHNAEVCFMYFLRIVIEGKVLLVLNWLSTTQWKRMGIGYIDPILLTSAQAKGEWSVSLLCRFSLGEMASGTRLIGGWVNPRSSLDDMQKWNFLPPPELELRPLGRPAEASRSTDYAIPAPNSLFMLHTFRVRNLGFWVGFSSRNLWKI
jgi:hypothetical protein